MAGSGKEKKNAPPGHTFEFNFGTSPGILRAVRVKFEFARAGASRPGQPDIIVTQNFPDNPNYQALQDAMLPVIEYAIKFGFSRKAMQDDMESNGALNSLDDIVTKIFQVEGKEAAFTMYQSALDEVAKDNRLLERPDIPVRRVLGFLEKTIEQAINSRSNQATKDQPSSNSVVYRRR